MRDHLGELMCWAVAVLFLAVTASTNDLVTGIGAAIALAAAVVAMFAYRQSKIR